MNTTYNNNPQIPEGECEGREHISEHDGNGCNIVYIMVPGVSIESLKSILISVSDQFCLSVDQETINLDIFTVVCATQQPPIPTPVATRTRRYLASTSSTCLLVPLLQRCGRSMPQIVHYSGVFPLHAVHARAERVD